MKNILLIVVASEGASAHQPQHIFIDDLSTIKNKYPDIHNDLECTLGWDSFIGYTSTKLGFIVDGMLYINEGINVYSIVKSLRSEYSHCSKSPWTVENTVIVIERDFSVK